MANMTPTGLSLLPGGYDGASGPDLAANVIAAMHIGGFRSPGGGQVVASQPVAKPPPGATAWQEVLDAMFKKKDGVWTGADPSALGNLRDVLSKKSRDFIGGRAAG